MFNDFCQMASNDFEDIRDILSEMTLEDLIYHTDLILFDLDPYERINYDVNMFCNGYDDRNGRIALLEKLFNDGVISALYLPCGYELDPDLKELLKPIDYSFFYTSSEDEMVKKEPAPLTDDLEVITGQLEISNPRWEHTTDELKTDSADKAVIGDLIELGADIKNYPEKAKVTFDIYDVSSNTPLRITSVESKNENGVAKAQWTVEDPEQKGENLKLAFEAIARSKASSRVEVPIIPKIDCDFVEAPDILFHHNSAVPCLDQNGTLIDSLTSVFKYAKENTDKEIVLFGHTDTSGDPDYNHDLSQWRAEGIKSVLDNNVNMWLDIVELASRVEDYQTILKSLCDSYGWPTDPGAVDNTNGQKTIDAVKAFQREYNNRFDRSLNENGIVDSKTWEALFEVIRGIVIESVKKETGEKPGKLVFAYDGKGVYPCGEKNPVKEKEKGNYKSKDNRRVEITFFEKGKTPQNIETKKENISSNTRQLTKKVIPVKSTKKGNVDTTDKLVFYCPSSDEYIEFNNSDAFSFITEESDKTAVLAKDIKELREQRDTAKLTEKAQEVKKKLESVLGTQTQVKAIDSFEELLLCKRDKNKKWGKPVIYVSRKRLRDRISNQNNGLKAIKRSRYDEQKELGEFLGLDDKVTNNQNPLTVVKANFWKSQGRDASVWKFTSKGKDGSNDSLSENDFISASAEAQLLRFAAGAGICSDISSILKGKPKLSVAGEASVTFSLAEGVANGALHIPDKNGVNILALFTSNDKLQELVHEGRVCSMMFKIAFSGYAFAGVSAQAMLALPQIDFTEMKPVSKSDRDFGSTSNTSGRNKDAYAGGTAGISATATAGGSLAASVEWKGHDTIKFSPLGEVKGTAEASAGIAIEVLAEAGLRNGEFRIKLGARAVAGLGGKLGTEIGLGIDEGYKFLTYVFRSFDYHFVIEVAGDAFDACVKLGIIKMTDVMEAMDEIYDTGVDLVRKAFRLGREQGIDIKNQMVKLINTDKKSEEIKNNVPEANGSILIGIMETPEDDDFDAIIKILEPATEHELKSILRVVGMSNPDIAKTKPLHDDPNYKKWQGDALREGIIILKDFGKSLEDYNNYAIKIMEIFDDKNIRIVN